MERLQKVLAQAGVASRRKCEEYIAAGRVMVNGEVVKETGVKVNPKEDLIQIDGRAIKTESKIYLVLHKPKGVITSANDPEGRKVVADYLKGIKERVYPVGRLDYDTEGLLILTNDGEFANLLTHPRHHVPRTYRATVNGTIHGSKLEQLARGVKLEDGMTAPAIVDYHDVNPEKNETVVSITIFEGRNRQVRRMFEAVGHPLTRLRRVSFGPILLGKLPRGVYRMLEDKEVEELRKAALAAESESAMVPENASEEEKEYGKLSGAFSRSSDSAGKKAKPVFKPKPKPNPKTPQETKPDAPALPAETKPDPRGRGRTSAAAGSRRGLAAGSSTRRGRTVSEGLPNAGKPTTSGSRNGKPSPAGGRNAKPAAFGKRGTKPAANAKGNGKVADKQETGGWSRAGQKPDDGYRSGNPKASEARSSRNSANSHSSAKPRSSGKSPASTRGKKKR